MSYYFKKEYIVIHHTGIKNDSKNDSLSIWESIKKSHQSKFKARFPWYISDYHFAVTKDLKIYNGHSLDYPCFHSGIDEINFKSISIAFFGNFNEELLDKKQFDLGVFLISDLVKKHSIQLDKIIKHNDLVNTSCPGKNFPFDELKKSILKNLDLNIWKKESVNFALTKGWIKNQHDHLEIVDLGTLLTILKNFYELEIVNQFERRWNKWQ